MTKKILGVVAAVAMLGSVTTAQAASVDTVYAQVGAFFFSNQWSGTCDVAGGGAGCNEEDPNWDGSSSFVPITSIDDSGLLVTGGTVVGGVLAVDAFSPTFGQPLGTITFDFGVGSFSLVGGAGTADGTVGIDALGAITGQVTSATGGVAFLLGAPASLPLDFDGALTVVPIPAAAWLFGSALLGLAGLRRRA